MDTIDGDLILMALAGRFDVIIHGCNCQHAMGAGIAKTIKQAFPEAWRADLLTPKGVRSKLGTISHACLERDGRRLVVVNGYTQFDWRGTGLKTDYEAVRQVMRAVKASFSGLRIGYPQIGAGLGGGDWGQIAQIINEELAGENHALVRYQPQAAALATDAPEPSSPLIYTGIGSRKTPEDVLRYMHSIARHLARHGYVLRSGAADGADSAFEAGCIGADGRAEIWLPWKGFNGHADTGLYPTKAHIERAQEVHPAWDRLGRGPRALHARNVGQILGADTATPSSFVLCWTPDGCERDAQRSRTTGGTGTAISLASFNDIPVFNLAREDAKDRMVRHVKAELAARREAGSAPPQRPYSRAISA